MNNNKKFSEFLNTLLVGCTIGSLLPYLQPSIIYITLIFYIYSVGTYESEQ